MLLLSCLFVSEETPIAAVDTASQKRRTGSGSWKTPVGATAFIIKTVLKTVSGVLRIQRSDCLCGLVTVSWQEEQSGATSIPFPEVLTFSYIWKRQKHLSSAAEGEVHEVIVCTCLKQEKGQEKRRVRDL